MSVTDVLTRLHFRLATPGDHVPVSTPLAEYPLICRAGTSDRRVFEQVFHEREYDCLPCDQQPYLILDGGANAGFTSAYFLTRFPKSRVIAIEPDPDNFRVLSRNLGPYGMRADCVFGAVWSHCTHVRIASTRFRDGGTWSRQVTEGGLIPAFDMPTLLHQSGVDRISILKLDIEGSEAVVFRSNLDWLDRVDTLLIELHDDSSFGPATPIFEQAIAGRGFRVWNHRDTVVCSRFVP